MKKEWNITDDIIIRLFVAYCMVKEIKGNSQDILFIVYCLVIFRFVEMIRFVGPPKVHYSIVYWNRKKPEYTAWNNSVYLQKIETKNALQGDS